MQLRTRLLRALGGALIALTGSIIAFNLDMQVFAYLGSTLVGVGLAFSTRQIS